MVPQPTGPAARSSTSSAEDRAAAFERLSAEIRDCRRCPLGATRTHAVVYRGGASPRLVFVGEAPGAAEDREGIPFVGRSGQILNAAIDRLPVAPHEVGILNVLKCRPPANRFDPAAARACRPFLERQLELLEPRAVVPLGASALRALDPRAPRILVAAGVARDGPNYPLFPLVHPAASLRSSRLRDRWHTDVARLGTWLAERPG